jgi:hypothetical protein
MKDTINIYNTLLIRYRISFPRGANDKIILRFYLI